MAAELPTLALDAPWHALGADRWRWRILWEDDEGRRRLELRYFRASGALSAALVTLRGGLRPRSVCIAKRGPDGQWAPLPSCGPLDETCTALHRALLAADSELTTGVEHNVEPPVPWATDVEPALHIDWGALRARDASYVPGSNTWRITVHSWAVDEDHLADLVLSSDAQRVTRAHLVLQRRIPLLLGRGEMGAIRRFAPGVDLFQFYWDSPSHIVRLSPSPSPSPLTQDLLSAMERDNRTNPRRLARLRQSFAPLRERPAWVQRAVLDAREAMFHAIITLSLFEGAQRVERGVRAWRSSQ